MNDSPAVRSDSQSPGHSRGPDKKRQTQACDGCRSKKRRCDGLRPVCTQCLKSRVRDGETIKCTYLTATKKRGPRRGYRSELIERLTTLEKMILPEQGKDSQMEPTMVPVAQGQLKELRAMMGKNNTVVSDIRPTIDVAEEGDEMGGLEMPSPDSGFSGSSSDSPEGLEMAYGSFPIIQQTAPFDIYNGTHADRSIVTDLGMAPPLTATEEEEPSNAEPMFGELETILGIGGQEAPVFPSLSASPRSKIWELSGLIDSNDAFPSFVFDGETFQDLGFNIPSPTSTNLTPSYAPSVDLYTHLRHLGSAMRTIELPNAPLVQDANDLYHPAMMNVLYANGAKLSAHPDLITQYGSRANAIKTFVLRAEEALMSKGVDVSVGMIQAMLMLGGLYYELDDGWKACKWIVEACNLCTIKHYDRAMHHIGIYAVLHGQDEDPVEKLPAECREARWDTWATALIYDSYAGLASGFPCLIEEADYVELLYDRRPWEDDMGYMSRKRREEENQRSRIASGMPGATIFHDSGMSAMIEGLFVGENGNHGRPGQAAIDFTRMIQICFLLRRVLRHIAQVDGRKGGSSLDHDIGLARGAASVLSSLPGDNDTRLLHESLVQWFSTLPVSSRGFESLAVFRTGVTGPAAAPDGHHWTRNPTMMHSISLFLVALAILHYPRQNIIDTQHNTTAHKIFRIDSFGTQAIRVSAPQVVTLVRRALTHLFRCAYEDKPIPLSPAPLRTTPDYSNTLRDTPFIPTHPPPPPHLCMSPMMALVTLLIICAELSSPASAAILQECLNDVSTVFLPFLDNLGRIYPMSVRYAARVRAVVGGVVGCSVEVGVWKGVWAAGWGVCGAGVCS
ncbi:uncharacterized protein SPPG_08975 [Spizellomyces punctatus DAOM BR117]|uniref:Zn(2)-C6 fungal-type domain-containing protein n=1 Tax=Spizellomyces punctatus (strain DAOM BR117) TaxID=645134 RepID=A0A0L0HPE9_SPIPD|nr:uncharacterized protein SPPG_08975 [Spizellomyces punctatus DAOM BR117]KND02967.1 hypothetical protein SPPG_08975 [Spizellomyces punctatus DAOM BR117]|eukprot:XP_016611006.1 hypothetical protein SPPG_08975 [Spizellomyces punctatus DAOM BR117]